MGRSSLEADGSLPHWLRRLVELTHQRTGIRLPMEQARRLREFVTTRAELAFGGDPSAWVSSLEGVDTRSGDWPAYLAVLTNRQTYFWRDVEQFATFRSVLTELARAHPARPLSIWSAACSTGEEPYSLAILALDMGIDVQIVASDINPAVLERAQGAVYHDWSLRNLDADQRRIYFESRGDTYVVREEVRAMVDFRINNLAESVVPSPVGSGWDLVVCRNVFIYFSRPVIAETTRRVRAHMNRDGRLVLAASENLHSLDVGFAPELIGARIAYRPIDPGSISGPIQTKMKSAPPVGEPTFEAIGSLLTGTMSPAPVAELAVPSPTPPGLQKVLEHAEEGELAESRAAAEAWVESRPTDPDAHLVLGHICLKQHDFEQALAAYAEATRLQPLLAEGYLFEGLARRKCSDWPGAEAALRRALFLSPDLWIAAWLLVGIHQRQGRTRDADRERRRTRELAKKDAMPELRTHPVFLDWFELDESRLRAALGLSRR